eukprot:7116512-Alexandrium_andersonii.AAC.1
MKKRSRFKQPADGSDPLLTVLARHITSATAVGKYDEAKQVSAGKQNSAAIIALAPLFRDLRGLQQNLSFTKTQ